VFFTDPDTAEAADELVEALLLLDEAWENNTDSVGVRDIIYYVT
jgi:hypothetical protein